MDGAALSNQADDIRGGRREGETEAPVGTPGEAGEGVHGARMQIEDRPARSVGCTQGHAQSRREHEGKHTRQGEERGGGADARVQAPHY